MIKAQTCTNIIEWVIVEGSKNKEDAIKNNELIKTLQATIKIVYLEYTGKKLGELRNIGNKSCVGDIIVCMDDDDYYPPERVQHCVESLEKSGYLLAGCSALYLYEYFMGKLYKFKGFHQNHSTNNCMAFKKEYLLNHKHDDLDMSEEKSFTNNFIEPMVQLDPKKCIVASSHNFNTFNKRELCVGGTIGLNPTLYEESQAITQFIPKNIFDKMKAIFYKSEASDYDIVYLCGGYGTKWNPKDKSLGGSEQAVVNLCNSWAKQGKKIAVYGDFISGKETELTFNNVEYINWKKFPFNHQFKTVILWRTYGFYCYLPFNLKAKNIYWDLHDNFANQDMIKSLYTKYGKKITKVLVKSEYHKSEFENYFKIKLNDNQYSIIPNGIKIDKFSVNTENLIRNPYRFCYVSYYTRGLQHIIPGIWDYIKEKEPRAELHLYYGMDMITDNEVKKIFQDLMKYKGVIDHGRQPIEMIVREKYMSSFQLYITNTISEIDCISIKESLVTGCIPLISNFGVFSEREGIHFDYKEDALAMYQIGVNIINLMKDQKNLDILRDVFKKSSTIMSWDTVGDKIVSLD
jgi:glycosyltransferase involved in cell wall biosynthesis